MAVDSAAMVTAIIAKLPNDWQPQWSSPSEAPRLWVEKMALDVKTIWLSIVLTTGTGPPPAGTYIHPHAVASITQSSTNMDSLTTYTAEAKTMFGILATDVTTHLQTNAAAVSDDGAISHSHALVTPPFTGLAATASTLKSTIIANLFSANIKGTPQWDQSDVNSHELIFGAICEGMLEHIDANGEIKPDVGNGHDHNITPPGTGSVL